MGIYPDEEWKKSGNRKTETVVNYYHVPGVTRVKVFEKIAEFEFRDDCYCCSCPEYGNGHDPYCRNHGAAGERPCELHDMPGTLSEFTGEMPISVQAERLRQSEVVRKMKL